MYTWNAVLSMLYVYSIVRILCTLYQHDRYNRSSSTYYFYVVKETKIMDHSFILLFSPCTCLGYTCFIAKYCSQVQLKHRTREYWWRHRVMQTYSQLLELITSLMGNHRNDRIVRAEYFGWKLLISYTFMTLMHTSHFSWHKKMLIEIRVRNVNTYLTELFFSFIWFDRLQRSEILHDVRKHWFLMYIFSLIVQKCENN